MEKVEQCDIFVLVLGKEITRPVIREYWRARKHKKPRLIFLKKCERTPATQKFIEKIRSEVKYAEFELESDLNNRIRQSVGTLLIEGVRQYKLSANDVLIITAFLVPRPQIGLGRPREISERKTASLTKSKGKENKIVIRNNTVYPQEITIETGASVKWISSDSSASHSIILRGVFGTFPVPIPVHVDNMEFTFDQAGTYIFYCVGHVKESGTIIVR